MKGTTEYDAFTAITMTVIAISLWAFLLSLPF